MPRIARAVVPGLPHHLTQRGNFGQAVFEDDDDRERYLAWVADYARRYGTRFWAYCLMTNHVHFIAVPETAAALASTFNHAHRRYARHINRRHGRQGHLWQGRFYSCVLDQVHLFAAVRYVERNPVRAGLVKRAEAFPWSSARAHVAGAKGVAARLLAGDCPLLEAIGDWSAYLAGSDEAAWIGKFRRATRTGRPLGNTAFVAAMEARLKRCLRAGSPGRPRKEMPKTQEA